MGRMPIESLVQIWADNPGAFEAENSRTQAAYRDQVESVRGGLSAAVVAEEVDESTPIPGEYTGRELEAIVEDLHDPEMLENMILAEIAGKNRDNAVAVLKQRRDALVQR